MNSQMASWALCSLYATSGFSKICVDGEHGGLHEGDMATDVLVQTSEFWLECQDVVLDHFLHFRIRWKRSVANDYCLREAIGVGHRWKVYRTKQ
jgi:hypothetical protein